VVWTSRQGCTVSGASIGGGFWHAYDLADLPGVFVGGGVVKISRGVAEVIANGGELAGSRIIAASGEKIYLNGNQKRQGDGGT
jgi:hypothetical protein